MWLTETWSNFYQHSTGSADDGRDIAIEVLSHRYVREKQHVMRFRQHAERMQCPKFREALLRIAAKEEEHAKWIAAKIKALGGELPPVIEVRCTNESNWDYLRSDLDDERRCVAEVEEEKAVIQSLFPDIVALIDLIEDDALKHREEIREMLRQSEPQTLWPA
jgi:rubrerythrin